MTLISDLAQIAEKLHKFSGHDLTGMLSRIESAARGVNRSNHSKLVANRLQKQRSNLNGIGEPRTRSLHGGSNAQPFSKDATGFGRRDRSASNGFC